MRFEPMCVTPSQYASDSPPAPWCKEAGWLCDALRQKKRSLAGAAQLSPDGAERRPPPQGRISPIKRCDTRCMWRVGSQLPRSCGGGSRRWARHNRERRKCKAGFGQAGSMWEVTTLHWAPEQPAVRRHKVTVSQAPTANVSHCYEETYTHSQLLGLCPHMNGE